MRYLKSFYAVFILIFFLSSCNIEPYEGEVPKEIDDLPKTCEEAVNITTDAAISYESASSADANFGALCGTYKTALKNQISVCGDQGGVFQLLIDNLGNCEGGGENVAEERAFMTANLKGEQYNNLTPSGYIFHNDAVSMDTFFVEDADVTYLKIQGGTNIFIIGNLTEINLYIPESYWAEGTYHLNIQPRAFDSDMKEVATPYVSLVLSEGNLNYKQVEGGKIIITEFNLDTRIIKGTFEFQFEDVSGNTPGSQLFWCKNGTFDYSLDDKYFD
ncbi:hypothetical protein [Algibacter sp. 2305UL17-15]|uniref:hypothetical protein n=1 Tax=Algibacter sp. 2305UL17-15 TaxID=3231268 RepID=UPI0034591DF0